MGNHSRSESESESAVLTVQRLTARYEGTVVLDDISFAVLPGEIFVIMGASGSGKSTLLRHLVGLSRPAAGTIALLGVDLAAASRVGLLALRKRIGVAFQNGALLNSMSVIENIELPLRQHTKLDPATIRIMSHLKLELMNLSGIDRLMPAQLSGGMQKRASLARAVVMDPELLFFDEPSAGLDPVNAAELDELLLKLRDALAMTIVVVTHALESALRIADRIMVLAEGGVVAIGTPTEITRHPDPRIRNMVERRPASLKLDPDEYLARLTAGA